jgi:hypothetical protein
MNDREPPVRFRDWCISAQRTELAAGPGASVWDGAIAHAVISVSFALLSQTIALLFPGRFRVRSDFLEPVSRGDSCQLTTAQIGKRNFARARKPTNQRQ